MKRLFLLLTLLIPFLITGSEREMQIIDILQFGAKPNDLKDDTIAIQSAVDYAAKVRGIVKFPKGTFYINANPHSGTIRLQSNLQIQMDEETILKVIPNQLSNYQIFNIYNQQNIKITGGTLVGDRYQHQGNTGEYGHGIYIGGEAKDIVISNVRASNFWGDGFYIGGNETNGTYPSNITITNCISDNNRRQGLSVTAGKNITIQNSTFSNTNGTAPEAGIDIERNSPYQLPLENVILSNNTFNNNNGYGLMFVFTTENIAQNNSIQYNKKGGIFIGGEAENTKTNKNLIIENKILNNGSSTSTTLNGNGIFVNFSSENTIKNNDISNNSQNGIELLNNVNENIIKNNTIQNNKGAGVQIWGGSTNNNRIIVQENTIQNNLANGLNLSRVETAQIIKNTFLNNRNLQIMMDRVYNSVIQENVLKPNKMKTYNSKDNTIINNK
ncbi:right-handed parallel beta-helix repeat-containing protein [Bacillus massiliigorillae]|uniref:right-handed parallel beta-helix repeat-containing protein n=1 Tax=Bacillus massiliigorillae TaxID=1243664 RepID=UPI0003A7EF3C|nr:right-handed parallel beta-helix repeat-containing protein [Bacillus massiliigorillae]